jgi:hypothetical protein
MAISFKDFTPQVLTRQFLGAIKEYEDIAEVVTRVNRWLAEMPVRVISVETLHLPKAPPAQVEYTPTLIEAMTTTGTLFQVIRVWYEEPPAAATGETTRL